MSEPIARDRERAAAFLAEGGSYAARLARLAELLATSRDEGAAADGTGAARELGACLSAVSVIAEQYGIDAGADAGNMFVSVVVTQIIRGLVERLGAVHDLATARLRSIAISRDAHVANDLMEIVRIAARR